MMKIEKPKKVGVFGVAAMTLGLGALEFVDISLRRSGLAGLGGNFGTALGNMGKGSGIDSMHGLILPRLPVAEDSTVPSSKPNLSSIK